MEENVIKNKCPKCKYITAYIDNIENLLEQDGEIVIRAECGKCGYYSDLYYKQIICVENE